MATSGASAVPQEPSALVSKIGTLTGIQGLPVRLSQLNNKSHRSSCHHLPRAGVTSVPHPTQLFTWVLGMINLWASTAGLPPSPHDCLSSLEIKP